MNPVQLHRWQWSDYHLVHADQTNLWIHIVAVPLFLAGNMLFLVGLVWTPLIIVGFVWSWWPIGFVLGGPVLSATAMAAQGNGHKWEATPPKPFTGAGNAVGRIFVEQWFTFPRFVVTGGWLRALRGVRSTGSPTT